MSTLKHPTPNQYTFEPDSPELKAKKEREFQEWCRTRTAFNIDNRMAWNPNGNDDELCKIEAAIVHNYAINLIMKTHADLEDFGAWKVYRSVSDAYNEYHKKGIPAKRSFNPANELEVALP